MIFVDLLGSYSHRRPLFRVARLTFRPCALAEPKLRYIEVCNEYTLKGFIGCTPEEHCVFYTAGYEAVNEANEKLGLEGESRVLVGGPAATGDIMP